MGVVRFEDAGYVEAASVPVSYICSALFKAIRFAGEWEIIPVVGYYLCGVPCGDEFGDSFWLGQVEFCSGEFEDVCKVVEPRPLHPSSPPNELERSYLLSGLSITICRDTP